MKQKLYLSIAAFFMLSFYSIAQSSLAKQAQPYFGQAGIKKKISELLAVKPAARKTLDSASIRLLKSRLNNFENFTKPDKEGHVIGVPEPPGEEKEEVAINALRPSSSTASTTATQQTWSNFLSTDFYDRIYTWPPDPSGAVSATQVIVSTNLGIKVHDKPAVTDQPTVTPAGYSGDKAHSTLFLALEQFFSPVLPEKSFISDPHIRYDRLSKRWFVIAIEGSQNDNYNLNGNNKVLLAVSDGDRITDSSSFTYYSFNTSIIPYNKNAPDAPFLDYPTLGVDNHSVLIGGRGLFFNNYGYPDSVNHVGYIIDKEKLMHGKVVVYSFQFGSENRTDGSSSGMIVPQGVYNDDPAAKKSFFAGTSANNEGIVVANIEYNQKNKPWFASENTVRVEPFNHPRDISSPGGLARTSPVSNFLFAAAIYKNKLTGNSSLWTAHVIGVNQSGRFINGIDSDFVREARNGARWYKIGNIYTKPGLLQSGTVYDGSQPSGRRAVQYFNPSVAASGQGHSIVSGTTAAYNEYLNVFAAGRYLGDPLGKTKPPVKVTNTTAIYAPYIDFGGGSHYYNIGRWGDFSQTVVDPLDDQTIWTFQEYANVDDSYGIRAVQFKAPPPATPAAIGTLSNKSDTTITLEGESVDNSGFFDPGKDIGGPGYNRLSIKSTGNIIVNNIKFISPTKISFTLNTANKPAGQYLLIITNPDGQLVVTDYTITANSTVIAGNNSSSAKALRDKIAQAYITGSEVFPNPTTANTTLQINAAKEHAARIVLVNVDGKKIFERNYSFSKGSNQAILPTEKLERGTYIAAVYNADNVLIATQKIVKQ